MCQISSKFIKSFCYIFTLDLYMNLEMTYWRLKNLVKSQHEGMNTAVVHELSGNSQVTWFEFALRSAMTKGNNFVLHIFIEICQLTFRHVTRASSHLGNEIEFYSVGRWRWHSFPSLNYCPHKDRCWPFKIPLVCLRPFTVCDIFIWRN